MKILNPDFDKRRFLKRLESINYLMLMAPLVLFGWVFLEKERSGGFRSVFWEQPDLMFHGAMIIGIGYVFNRTLVLWKSTVLKALEQTPEIDEKLRKLFKPIVWRNLMWTIGAMISTYGLYVKGDMFYTLFFTAFLVLITANRPSGPYFAKLLRLKDEEKKWMEKH